MVTELSKSPIKGHPSSIRSNLNLKLLSCSSSPLSHQLPPYHSRNIIIMLIRDLITLSTSLLGLWLKRMIMQPNFIATLCQLGLFFEGLNFSEFGNFSPFTLSLCTCSMTCAHHFAKLNFANHYEIVICQNLTPSKITSYMVPRPSIHYYEQTCYVLSIKTLISKYYFHDYHSKLSRHYSQMHALA